MASGKELALQLLPTFAENVLARKPPKSYGAYARLIGRDPAKEAITIGPAMHAIGAVCVLRQLPVAPLYWVTRTLGQRRQIFATDLAESCHILDLGRFDTMYVVAREYHYSRAEFDAVRETLTALIEKCPPDWSPHFLWHLAIFRKPQGEARTYLERAMTRYEALLAGFRKS